MNALEWILILELVLLFIAAVMGAVGMFIAKQDENDPIHVFCSTFWREFLWPPMTVGGGRFTSSGGGGSARPQAADADASDDDAFYGRVKGSGKSDLLIVVEANAAADELVGRDGDGIKIRVTGEAGDGRANKALIEMVAQAMGIKPFQVALTKGHYQTRKTVQIQGMTIDDVRTRLDGMSQAD